MKAAARGAVLVAGALLAACAADGPQALHDTTQVSGTVKQVDFFALPFPTDLRLGSDGKINLDGFPSGLSAEVDRYVGAFNHRLAGWGTQSAIYFRFSAPLDARTLPDAAGSLAESASVQVIDVTPGSPDFDHRQAIVAVFHPTAGDYIGANWLSVRPVAGLPLREKTTYAAIVTRDVHGEGGAPIERDPRLDAALRSDGPLAYAPLRAWLAAHPSMAKRLANATVFTTQDTTGQMARLRQATYAKAAAPTVKNLQHTGTGKTYEIFTGEYDAPNFQEGEVPYASEGGRIVDDPDGLPKVQRTETMRFALTIPTTSTMPGGGWPLVVYAHGTGGNYRSFIADKSADGVAHVVDAADATLADMAMISIDQPLHGARAPAGSGDQFFFNLFNADALFDNLKQGAADDYQLLRLVQGFNEASAPTTNQPIRFDLDRLYFKGHSQGGITGALFLVAEPMIQAAILSGTGGNLVQSLLNKEPYPAALQLLFDAPYDDTHPVLNLFGAFGESSDPANFARRMFREPLADVPPKSLFLSLGLGDTDTPNPTTWSYALASGTPPVLPMLQDVETLALAGLAWTSPPLASNLLDGKVTAGLLQYTPPAGKDGHFVIFDVLTARNQSNRFLATHAKDGIATITAP